jgi:hypothetical protein
MIAYSALTIDCSAIFRKSGDAEQIGYYISMIGRQAHHECTNDKESRNAIQLMLFRTNLKGDARSFLNMLTAAEREN